VDDAMGDHHAPSAIEEPKMWGSATLLARNGVVKNLTGILEGKGGEKAVTAKDEYSCDSISWAARNGRHDVVELLISKDADLESKSFGGMRPLHHATNSNEENIMRELIAKGVDVNATDENGNTPVHYACRRCVAGGERAGRAPAITPTLTFFAPLSFLRARRGVMGIVQLLVEKKGDITAKNTAGMTPLHTACNNGHVSTGQKNRARRAERDPPPYPREGRGPRQAAGPGFAHGDRQHTVGVTICARVLSPPPLSLPPSPSPPLPPPLLLRSPSYSSC
jgi:hypothetical protein